MMSSTFLTSEKTRLVMDEQTSFFDVVSPSVPLSLDTFSSTSLICEQTRLVLGFSSTFAISSTSSFNDISRSISVLLGTIGEEAFSVNVFSCSTKQVFEIMSSTFSVFGKTRLGLGEETSWFDVISDSAPLSRMFSLIATVGG
ncbi:hypothetical protein Hanom_Chr16g01415991 [Helianthus anomalus]